MARSEPVCVFLCAGMLLRYFVCVAATKWEEFKQTQTTISIVYVARRREQNKQAPGESSLFVIGYFQLNFH